MPYENVLYDIVLYIVISYHNDNSDNNQNNNNHSDHNNHNNHSNHNNHNNHNKKSSARPGTTSNKILETKNTRHETKAQQQNKHPSHP